ncbi:MAG: hypothetical protein R2762_19665 [Bryobacteraceae bacterium]
MLQQSLLFNGWARRCFAASACLFYAAGAGASDAGHAPGQPAMLYAHAGDEHGPSSRMLNNEGLVLLARAGYNERFLAELVRTKPSRFDTSVEGLVYMAKHGISERLVRAILVREREQAERQAIEDAEPLDIAPASLPAAAKPVRLKVVKQGILVPADPKATIAPGAIIVEERGAYWAKPVSTGRM